MSPTGAGLDRRRALLAGGALGAAFLASPFERRAEAAEPLPVEEPAPGVLVHVGAHEDFTPENAGGIANLAFYLMSQGGTHPRSKTTVQVPAISIEYATALFCHGDWEHLSGNLFFMFLFGRLVEERLGSAGVVLAFNAAPGSAPAGGPSGNAVFMSPWIRAATT